LLLILVGFVAELIVSTGERLEVLERSLQEMQERGGVSVAGGEIDENDEIERTD
jgi:hypothetical protein